jgi:hypothetical protein
MSKILVLAESGMGKSTSLGNVPELNIEGLDPKETFIIACANKGLPFAGWMNNYKKGKEPMDGNYWYTNDANTVATGIKVLAKSERIRNIVVDDTNYLMQDYYMNNAMKSGYDVFKKIGLFMGAIFDAINLVPIEKHFIMMAHFEEYNIDNAGKLSFRMKTVGKMTNQYITPEGKFEIVLFGTQRFNDQEKTVEKVFVTNYDGDYPAKSPIGMFNDLYIPNDMGYVIKHIDAYNTGVQVIT